MNTADTYSFQQTFAAKRISTLLSQGHTMKFATPAARYFLGAVFFVFGLNGFLQFIKLPPMPADAAAFLGAMIKTGYLMTLVKVTEIVCGALLLANLFVPLALVALTPILVNIVLFHAFLTPPTELVGPAIFLAAYLFLVWRYRAHYRTLFAMKADGP